MKVPGHHILISRTDAIGDVTLTLPLCGYLKHLFPNLKISFLGRTYTAPVIACSSAVDDFINYDELKSLSESAQVEMLAAKKIDVIFHVFPNRGISILAKKAGISARVGTMNRMFHWFTCNRLIRLSRRNSALHEAQLNIVFLRAFGIHQIPELSELPQYYNLKPPGTVPLTFQNLLDNRKFNLILHPKSHGSGKEWSLDNFKTVAEQLPEEKFKIFITGSEKEKIALHSWISVLPQHVVDLTGKMSLDELISFIAHSNGMVGASTGPLHLAASAGIHCLGLYPQGQAIDAKRWAPVGYKAEFIESAGEDLSQISPEMVCRRILNWIEDYSL